MRRRKSGGSVIEIMVLLFVLASGPFLFGYLYLHPALAAFSSQLVSLAGLLTVGFFGSIGIAVALISPKNRANSVLFFEGDRRVIHQIHNRRGSSQDPDNF